MMFVEWDNTHNAVLGLALGREARIQLKRVTASFNCPTWDSQEQAMLQIWRENNRLWLTTSIHHFMSEISIQGCPCCGFGNIM